MSKELSDSREANVSAEAFTAWASGIRKMLLEAGEKNAAAAPHSGDAGMTAYEEECQETMAEGIKYWKDKYEALVGTGTGEAGEVVTEPVGWVYQHRGHWRFYDIGDTVQADIPARSRPVYFAAPAPHSGEAATSEKAGMTVDARTIKGRLLRDPVRLDVGMLRHSGADLVFTRGGVPVPDQELARKQFLAASAVATKPEECAEKCPDQQVCDYCQGIGKLDNQAPIGEAGGVEPVAWLHRWRKPGKVTTWASVEENDYPRESGWGDKDEYGSISIPLFAAQPQAAPSGLSDATLTDIAKAAMYMDEGNTHGHAYDYWTSSVDRVKSAIKQGIAAASATGSGA